MVLTIGVWRVWHPARGQTSLCLKDTERACDTLDELRQSRLESAASSVPLWF